MRMHPRTNGHWPRRSTRCRQPSKLCCCHCSRKHNLPPRASTLVSGADSLQPDPCHGVPGLAVGPRRPKVDRRTQTSDPTFICSENQTAKATNYDGSEQRQRHNSDLEVSQGIVGSAGIQDSARRHSAGHGHSNLLVRGRDGVCKVSCFGKVPSGSGVRLRGRQGITPGSPGPTWNNPGANRH